MSSTTEKAQRDVSEKIVDPTATSQVATKETRLNVNAKSFTPQITDATKIGAAVAAAQNPAAPVPMKISSSTSNNASSKTVNANTAGGHYNNNKNYSNTNNDSGKRNYQQQQQQQQQRTPSFVPQPMPMPISMSMPPLMGAMGMPSIMPGMMSPMGLNPQMFAGMPATSPHGPQFMPPPPPPQGMGMPQAPAGMHLMPPPPPQIMQVPPALQQQQQPRSQNQQQNQGPRQQQQNQQQQQQQLVKASIHNQQQPPPPPPPLPPMAPTHSQQSPQPPPPPPPQQQQFKASVQRQQQPQPQQHQHQYHQQQRQPPPPPQFVPPQGFGMMPPPPPGMFASQMVPGPGGAPMMMSMGHMQGAPMSGGAPVPGMMPFPMPMPGQGMPFFPPPPPPPPIQQQQQQPLLPPPFQKQPQHQPPMQASLSFASVSGHSFGAPNALMNASGSMSISNSAPALPIASRTTPKARSLDPNSTALDSGIGVVHPISGTPSAPVRVSVGNASLAARYSKEPPKFSCVLLAGIPAVGKTSMGRKLVDSLQTDNMGWSFFSGADALPEAPTKRTVWETTKEVFDALNKRLEELMEQQREKRNIKGLVIDKNCKGIEDIYYLNALLKSKDIPFVGIIGMETDDDELLIKRMGGDEELREKLKYHRVTHARVAGLARAASMYRSVDAAKSEEEVIEALRTMVLGCCAQPPSRGILTHHYDTSRANTMLDAYNEYYNVMTHLFSCVSTRGFHFPGTTDYMPFSAREMTDKNRIGALKSRYGVRRKVDGNRFLVLYYNSHLFLIPSHMRAVLRMPQRAWLGGKLDNIASFLLEGDLVRLTRDRQKEKFLVFDAHFWSETSAPAHNILIRMDWTERQSCLKSHLCAEEQAFFPPETECVIVHHATHKFDKITELLDSEEYPSDGLVFQPINLIHRSDHIFIWRPPPCITVDFRVGSLQPEATREANVVAQEAVIAAQQLRRSSLDPHHDLPLRTYALECYDKMEKKYVQYENATVGVRHPDVVEGCIVTCSLRDDIPNNWMFLRIRYDLLRPAYKLEVDDLLSSCIVPRAKLVSWLIAEHFVTVEIPKDPSVGGSADNGMTPPATLLPPPPPPPPLSVPDVPPPSYGVATGSVAAMFPSAAMQRSTATAQFSSAAPLPAAAAASLPPPPPPPPLPSSSSCAAATAAPTSAAAPSGIQLLASIVPSLHVVREENSSAAAVAELHATSTATSAAAPASAVKANRRAEALKEDGTAAMTEGRAKGQGTQTCAQCHKRKLADEMRVDKRDRRNYCLACWERTGWAFCDVCGRFKEGKRQRQQADKEKREFICNGCAKTSNVGRKASPEAEEDHEETHKEEDTGKQEARQQQQTSSSKQKNDRKKKTPPAEGNAATATADEMKETKPQRGRGKKKETTVSADTGDATTETTKEVSMSTPPATSVGPENSTGGPAEAKSSTTPNVVSPLTAVPEAAASTATAAKTEGKNNNSKPTPAPPEKKGGMCAQQ